MVGHDDAVGAELEQLRALVAALHTLHHQWAVPELANPAQLLECRRPQLLHDLGKAPEQEAHLGHAPVGDAVADEVEGPPRPRCHACHEARRDTRRELEPVAVVPFARRDDRGVDRDAENGVPRVADSPDQRDRVVAITCEIELVPGVAPFGEDGLG